MDNTSFNKVIDFAVEKEVEAVKFYADLRKRATFPAMKGMLQEIEDMEKDHILALEQLRVKGLSDGNSNSAVSDLKISEYMVEETEFSPDSFHEVVLIAMKREEAASRLYSDISSRFEAENSDLSSLFKRLAAEETKHKLVFEQLYDDFVLRDN